jgi:hypothetical protein
MSLRIQSDIFIHRMASFLTQDCRRTTAFCKSEPSPRSGNIGTTCVGSAEIAFVKTHLSLRSGSDARQLVRSSRRWMPQFKQFRGSAPE